MRVLSLSPYPFWDFEDRKGMPSIYWGQKGFVDAGHAVFYAFPGPKNRQYDYDGIQMVEFKLQFPVVPARHIWLHRVSLKLYWLAYVVAATIKGVQLCRAIRPAVVYGHFLHGAPVAWLVGRIWRIPNITRLYGTFLSPWVGSVWGRIRKFDEVLAFKVPCSYLIVTNDGMRGDACAAALGVRPQRLRFWRNGVDKDMYNRSYDKAALKDSLSIPRSNKIILSVSRLVGWKRVDRLIKSLPAILSQCPDTTAVIVGDGEERSNLERLCRTVGVHDQVRFVGLIPHAEVPRFMHAADIFVSLYDLANAGNPLLEALCCGKCIVSVNNGGTGEINRNRRVAVLLEEAELHILPDVLVGLLRDDARREEVGRAAREYAVKHLETWPERMRREVELVEELVGRTGRVASGPESTLEQTQAMS